MTDNCTSNRTKKFFKKLTDEVKNETGITILDDSDLNKLSSHDMMKWFESIAGIYGEVGSYFPICNIYTNCAGCWYKKKYGACEDSRNNPVYKVGFYLSEIFETMLTDFVSSLLLPCPFCGGKAEYLVEVNEVVCTGCELAMQNGGTIADIIYAWNKRAIPVRPAEELSGSVCFGCRQRDEWIRLYQDKFDQIINIIKSK